jgi:ketosteroid isomerase-like protein
MIRPELRIAAALLASLALTDARAHNSADAEIREVDARFRNAMIHGDADELAEVVADDAKIIHGAGGGIQSKAGLIRDFRAYHIQRYDRTPVYSKVSGETAILLSVTHKVLPGKQVDTTTTEVLVRPSGRWQILILQNTDHPVG